VRLLSEPYPVCTDEVLSEPEVVSRTFEETLCLKSGIQARQLWLREERTFELHSVSADEVQAGQVRLYEEL
jgi:hypothetical protein